MSTKKTEPQPAEQEPQPAPAQEPKVLTMAPAAQPISALMPIAPPSPEEVLTLAENQIKIRKGYVKLVARQLRPQDVLVFGEEVYLPAKPCQDILSWARIRVKPHWPVEEHHYNSPDGEYIEFVITATLTDTGGREVDVMGNRSTRDEFFGIAGKLYPCPQCGEPCKWQKVNPNDQRDSTVCAVHGKVWVKKENIVIKYLPIYDVDVPSVRSAAVTNLWNKALKAIGLMPTLQDLADEGMDISKVKRVDFKGGDGKSSSQSTTPKQQPPQSNQPKAAAPSSTATATSAKAATLPKSQIPDKVHFGTLESIKPGTTQPKKDGKPTGEKGRPFLGLIVDGVKITCFDDKELALDTRGLKKRAFDLLLGAVGQPVAFRVKTNGQYENVTGYERIGDYEWDQDGIPILRREPAQHTMEEAFEAQDEDVPKELW